MASLLPSICPAREDFKRRHWTRRSAAVLPCVVDSLAMDLSVGIYDVTALEARANSLPWRRYQQAVIPAAQCVRISSAGYLRTGPSAERPHISMGSNASSRRASRLLMV